MVTAGEPGRIWLAPDSKLIDQALVPIEASCVQIIEQAPTFAYQSQQPTARMMVFRVCFEVFGKLFDASREQRDLNFRGTAVVCGPRIVGNYFSLASSLKGHQVYILFLLFRWYQANRAQSVSKAAFYASDLRPDHSGRGTKRYRLLIDVPRKCVSGAVKVDRGLGLMRSPVRVRRRGFSPAVYFDALADANTIGGTAGHVHPKITVASPPRLRCDEPDRILFAQFTADGGAIFAQVSPIAEGAQKEGAGSGL